MFSGLFDPAAGPAASAAAAAVVVLLLLLLLPCCHCGSLNYIRHAPLCSSFGRRLKSVNLAKVALAQAGRLPLC